MDPLKMYFLLRMGIFQPAMLVYQRLSWKNVKSWPLRNFSWNRQVRSRASLDQVEADVTLSTATELFARQAPWWFLCEEGLAQCTIQTRPQKGDILVTIVSRLNFQGAIDFNSILIHSSFTCFFSFSAGWVSQALVFLTFGQKCVHIHSNKRWLCFLAEFAKDTLRYLYL